MTNEDAGTISIISTATQDVIGEIAVGTRPRGVEVSRDGEHVYVALSGSPKCPPTLVGRRVREARRRQEQGRHRRRRCAPARGVARAARRLGSRRVRRRRRRSGRLFVSNEDTSELSIVDLATGGMVRTVDVGGEPEGVRLRPDRKAVYVTSESDHAVSVVDTESGARARQHRGRLAPARLDFLRGRFARFRLVGARRQCRGRRRCDEHGAQDDCAACRLVADGACAVAGRSTPLRRERPGANGVGRRPGDSEVVATCASARARGASGSRPTASSCTRPTGRRTTFRSSTPNL